MKPRVALLNDTSLYNNHFGCQLVAQTFREQFARTGLDLVCSLPLQFDPERAERRLREVDLAVVNGEGSIHHGRNLHVLDLALRFPTALGFEIRDFRRKHPVDRPMPPPIVRPTPRAHSSIRSPLSPHRCCVINAERGSEPGGRCHQ